MPNWCFVKTSHWFNFGSLIVKTNPDARDRRGQALSPTLTKLVCPNFNVTGFVTSDNLKFLLLHKQRSEDSIRRFFLDVRDLYLKVLLNPFYEPKTPISNSQFEARVQSLARLHLH